MNHIMIVKLVISWGCEVKKNVSSFYSLFFSQCKFMGQSLPGLASPDSAVMWFDSYVRLTLKPTAPPAGTAIFL